MHCTPHFISPGVDLEILILPFSVPALHARHFSLFNAAFKSHLSRLFLFESFIFLSFYKCGMKTGDGTLK